LSDNEIIAIIKKFTNAGFIEERMATVWHPYIPYHVLDHLLNHPDENPIGRDRSMTAVTLFADISGFSAMSEALGHSGKIGTEELTQVLNSYFEPMIALIESYGGIIGKFGGDAMTVLFPYSAETQADVVQRAVTCAMLMQREMTRYTAIQTSAGVFALTMKIGIGMGTVHVANVGDPDQRVEFVIAGRAIDSCSDAEHLAESGQVVVQNTLLPLLSGVTLSQQYDGFTQVNAFEATITPQPLPALPDFPSSRDAFLQRFVHPSIEARLKIARSDFVDEHRKITLMFVNFTTFDYDNDLEAIPRLQAYMYEVVRIIQRYRGYLNKIDMGDKGSKYMVLFGAPISYEDDEDRALRCALELRAVPSVDAKIGVNTGFVFAGHVGAATRREYTVMGDVVNVSARLMQIAQPGQILVGEATHDSLPGKFLWDPLDPVRVKGKSQPIRIYTLEAIKLPQNILLREPDYALPMVGRDGIMHMVQSRISLTLQARGQILAISGDAGMGKSRLSAEIIRNALRESMVGYGGECQSYNTHLGYVVWNNIWRGFFLLDANAPVETQIEQLQRQLEALNPDYLQRIPLLGVVLNLAVPENDFTQNLDASLRRELLESLLLDLLRERSKQQPILIVLEDCHWMDPQSQALLEIIARNCSTLRLLIVLLYRPINTPLVPPFDHYTEIELPLFTEDETRQLIELKLAQLFTNTTEPSPVLVERITQIAGGNPFYVDELMNLLHDRDIDVTGVDRLLNTDLPPTLHALIQSRVDELSENEKTVLKIASVIGRLFRARWIPGSYPEIGPFDHVLRQLNRLEMLELTPLDRSDPELEYLFKHILTQQVAYDNLSYALRENLHDRVGRFIETTYDDDITPFLFLIAFHYGNSRNRDRQQFYYRLAGDHARKLFLNEAALDYYQRLLPLLDDSTGSGDVLFHLGEVWQHIGRWDEAQVRYREALERTQDDPKRLAYLWAALGDVLSYDQSHDEAVTLLERALDSFASLSDFEGHNRVLKSLGYLYIRMGDYDRARTYAQEQLRIAEEQGNRVAASDAAQTLGQVAMFTGQNDEALRYFREAAEAAEQADYKQGVIYSLGNLTGVHVNLGNYQAALESTEQALQAAKSIGYTRAAAVIVGNRGHVYEQVGMYDEAIRCYTEGLQQTLEVGDYPSIQLNIGNLAQVRFKQRAYEDAAYLYQLAAAMDRTLDLPYFLCGYLLGSARTAGELGDSAEALSLSEQARQVAENSGETSVAFQSTLYAALFRQQNGQITSEQVAEALQAIRETLEEGISGELVADLLYQIWRLNTEDAALQQQARDLYQTLYGQTPTAHYRERLLELGGIGAAELLVLPPLPMTSGLLSWRELIETRLREYLDAE
jgi:class 3 adenylate cyclase/tetratricopeptide (TPR) repeat protein